MKLKLFKTKDGYSRVKSEELEEISAQNILTEEDTDLKDQDGSEDTPVTPDVESVTPVVSTEAEEQGVETGILNTLRSLIQDEYEAIDGYNNAYQMLIELDKYENVAEILRHIMLEEYSHVGELQKCLAEIDPEAFQSLDSGEDDAEDILDVEPEAINTNEALEKFYVTTYGPDYTSGPEEGGYTSKGTVLLSSKPMDSLEAAHQYVKEFEDEGIELSETSTTNVWRVENDSTFELIAIETDANRGEYHSPAKTWVEAEMGLEFDKPFFDAEGKVLPEDPAKTAAREADESKSIRESEEVENVYTKKNGDYLVKGDNNGYQAFSKDNVHLGYIDEEDPQEAQFKFDKNQFTESKESEESELITQYINNGEFDKLEKVKDGTNVTWKLKDTLTESKNVADFPEDSEAGKWLKALLLNADLELENPKILDSYIGKNFADFTLNINGDVIKYRVHKGGNVTIKESLKAARRKPSDPKQIEKAEKAMFDSLMNGSSNTEWMIQDAKMIFGLSYDEAVKAFRNAHNKYIIMSGELDESKEFISESDI